MGPPENTKYIKQDILDLFYSEVEQFNSTCKYVILLGDVNARTADIEDICNIDDEVLNSVQIDADVVFNVTFNRELINKDISYKRVSKDKTSTRLGRVLINFCKINDLLIVNGREFDDKNIGNFTYRNASVVDYTIVSTQSNCSHVLKLTSSVYCFRTYILPF